MSYSLEQGPQSNYKIVVTVSPEQMESTKQAVLTSYQKDVAVSGFRKGHAPLSEVEKQLNPQYFMMAMYEQIITDNLKTIVSKEEEKQFIGSPYDINFDKKGDDTVISFSLDTYPVVEAASDAWKKMSMTAITPDVDQKDIDASIYTFKKQYASYEDADKIADGTVTRVNYDLLDDKGEKFDSSFLFVGDEEAAEHPQLKDLFRDKQKDDTVELDYDEKKIPAPLVYKKDKGTPAKLSFVVGDVKKIVLPTFDKAKIAELFGEDAHVTSEAEIDEMIAASMQQEKVQAGLMQQVEDILRKLKDGVLTVSVPKTMVDQEVEQRIKSMKERFGGDDKFAAYVKQLGEEKEQEMMKEISDAAGQSLEKFLMLRKFVELLELDVDRQKGLDAETKIYEKLTGETLWKSELLEKLNSD